MTPNSELNPLHTAVSCYIAALQCIGQCLADASPAVGAPYRERLSRLRTKLAFNASPESLEQARVTLEAELAEFARKVSRSSPAAAAPPGAELHGPLEQLELELVRLASRQEYYGNRLWNLATSSPEQPGPANGLVTAIESMRSELQLAVHKIREDVETLEGGIAEAQAGRAGAELISGEEMSARIEVCAKKASPLTLICFHVRGGASERALSEIGSRLAVCFRARDAVARWTGATFLLMFRGGPQDALHRSQQAEASVSGNYGGEELTLDASLAEFEQLHEIHG